MKKNILKFLSALMLLIPVSSFLYSCSDKDEDEMETTITYNNLPQDAQTFLEKFFPDVTVRSIEKETVGNVVVYDVELANGYEVVFNSEGTWTEVDAPDGMTIPSGIAPEEIVSYLDENYPDYGINEINLTGTGYNVELVTGLVLYFNEAFEVTGMQPNSY